MARLMEVIVSAAMTVDGFIDDSKPERLLLSSEPDLAEVDALRATCDAILVGAWTVRADNPSLATRGAVNFALRERLGKPPHPAKVTLTRTGSLDPSSRFFTAGGGARIVFCGRLVPPALQSSLSDLAETISSPEDHAPPVFVIEELARRGVERLLIEGGTEILSEFLEGGLVDRMRLAIAPMILGLRGKTRLVDIADFSSIRGRLTLASIEKFESTAVLWFDIAKT